MELAAWVILGAVAGFAAGVTLFEDDGLTAGARALLGALGGATGGFFAAWLRGTVDPINTPDSIALMLAVVVAATVVVLAETALQRRGFRV